MLLQKILAIINCGMLAAVARLLRDPISIGRHVSKRLVSKTTWRHVHPTESYESYGLRMDFSTPLVLPKGISEGYESASNMLTNLSDVQKARLKLLRDQLQSLKPLSLSKHYCLPDYQKVSDRQWLELLACTNWASLDHVLYQIYQRQVYHHYRDATPEMTQSAVPIFSRLDCLPFYNARLISELLFCDELILDMSFNSVMPQKVLASFAHDLRYVVSYNRQSRQPFRLHLCGPDLNSSQILASIFRAFLSGGLNSKEDCDKGMLAVMNEKLPIDFTNSCFSKLVPNLRNAVYIIPGAKKPVIEYDPDKIYVLPGFAYFLHRAEFKSAAINRAKSLGLSYYSLPSQHSNYRLSAAVQDLLTLKNSRFFVE